MAFTCLDASATGLSALTTNLNVIANNLANANTDGFKSSRVNFQDLLYLEQRQPGLENVLGDLNPTGLYAGVGTRVSGTQLNLQEGPRLDRATTRCRDQWKWILRRRGRGHLHERARLHASGQLRTERRA